MSWASINGRNTFAIASDVSTDVVFVFLRAKLTPQSVDTFLYCDCLYYKNTINFAVFLCAPIRNPVGGFGFPQVTSKWLLQRRIGQVKCALFYNPPCFFNPPSFSRESRNIIVCCLRLTGPKTYGTSILFSQLLVCGTIKPVRCNFLEIRSLL